jgi:predicted DCC family thiol-disulfide oxidoreductase YuxK
MTTQPSTLVTLVDGDCALCSTYAAFISAMDPRGRVYFETQQSEQGRALLRRANMVGFTS